jgi:sugar phosphate isomerase/epimerase
MHSGGQSRRAVLAAGVSGLAAGLIGDKPARAAGPEPAVADGQAEWLAKARPADDVPAVVKVGLAAYSFRDSLDKPGKPGKISLFDLMDMCARWRIDGLELTSYYFLNNDDAYLNAIKRKMYLTGLQIVGSPIGNNFCAPPGPALDREVAGVKKWADVCVKLGAPTMRIFAGRQAKGRSREQTFKSLTGAIREACDYAGSKGVLLVLEDHGYMTETADDVLRILDAVKHDWLGVNLDTGNLKGDAYGQMARLAPRAVTCHFKAAVWGANGKPEPPDCARIVQILREARYRGFMSLEYEGREDPHTAVPAILEKMRSAARAANQVH